MKTVPVYFATSTGNTENLANTLQKKLSEKGIHNEVINIADAVPKDLLSHTTAVFIVSTWGDGEPPDNALDYWETLSSEPMDLSELHYCVFGLGDSGYTEFNAFARMLDESLCALGAKRICKRVEADVSFDDDFEKWAADLIPLLHESHLRESHLRENHRNSVY